ncbi:hypothetical protein GPALN_005302 [Globodera pallida]|nr:hypothetical protein GPALN_005302 [Globodera pallida]
MLSFLFDLKLLKSKSDLLRQLTPTIGHWDSHPPSLSREEFAVVSGGLNAVVAVAAPCHRRPLLPVPPFQPHKIIILFGAAPPDHRRRLSSIPSKYSYSNKIRAGSVGKNAPKKAEERWRGGGRGRREEVEDVHVPLPATSGTTTGKANEEMLSNGRRCHCAPTFSIWRGADECGEDGGDGSQLLTTEHRKRRRRRIKTSASCRGRERLQLGHLQLMLRVSSPFSHRPSSPSRKRLWRIRRWKSSRSSSLSSASCVPSPSPPSFPFFGACTTQNCAAAKLFRQRCSVPAPFCLHLSALLLFISSLFMSPAVAQRSSAASVPPTPNLTVDDDLSFMDNIWRIPILPNNLAESLHDTFHQHQSRSFRKIATIPWKPVDDQMCHVWTSLAPGDLCAQNSWGRLRKMREMSLFTKCPEGFANLQLIELFRLDWRSIRSEEDLVAHSEHLREGHLGSGCLLGPANSVGCLSCFERLQRALEQVESVHWAFANLLHRFDCRLAKWGLASATQPFSPNTTCHNCAEWYRKWLLVNLVDIWKHPPCINWCYYTQLACPHLATNKVVEFAGHPVFLCKDQRLSVDQRPLNCSCFHPCDMVQDRLPGSLPPPPSSTSSTSSNSNSNGDLPQQRKAKSESGRRLSPKKLSPSPEPPPFDFFPASIYCERRNELCTRKNKGRG